MTPQFLRSEAARFRGMAETSERETSRLRLLAMATDYESRAQASDGTIEPDQSETITETSEADPGDSVKVKIARRIGRPSKEAV